MRSSDNNASGGSPDERPRLLGAHEVAEIIGMTVDYVYVLCRKGEIPHLKFGRTLRFRDTDIDQWLESRLSGGTA